MSTPDLPSSHFRSGADWENKMANGDSEALIALLHAHTVALTALYASHPQPQQLSKALLAVETKSHRFEHPGYEQTLQVLREAIPET